MEIFDEKVTLMKINGDRPGRVEGQIHAKIVLGNAIALVQQQKPNDHWRFSALGDETFFSPVVLERLALTLGYQKWCADNI